MASAALHEQSIPAPFTSAFADLVEACDRRPDGYTKLDRRIQGARSNGLWCARTTAFLLTALIAGAIWFLACVLEVQPEGSGDSKRAQALYKSGNVQYQRLTTGSCSDISWNPIKNKEDCEAAALSLSLMDVDITYTDVANRPEGCYYAVNSEDNSQMLWLDTSALTTGKGAETSEGTMLRQPICANPSFTATRNSGSGFLSTVDGQTTSTPQADCDFGLVKYLMWKLDRPGCPGADAAAPQSGVITETTSTTVAITSTTRPSNPVGSFKCNLDEAWSSEEKTYCCDTLSLGCSSEDSSSSSASPPLSAEAEDTPMAFVGCYTSDGPYTATEDDINARTSTVCAKACRQHTHMMLYEGGQCVCQDRPPPRFVAVKGANCGQICKGEAQLAPLRFCGDTTYFAVYALGA